MTYSAFKLEDSLQEAASGAYGLDRKLIPREDSTSDKPLVPILEMLKRVFSSRLQ